MSSNRFYPTQPFLAASAAVFRGDRVMLASRGRAPMEGLFSLPGGGVEAGETLGEAALRELREETGVEAKLLGPVAPVEVIERDAEGRVSLHIVIVAHAARWVSGEPQTGPEAREIRWVTEAEIAGLPTTPGLPGILKQAFALHRSAP
jgi:ADP-ribose pyrophosphatase YjhB (NUDIX family)